MLKDDIIAIREELDKQVLKDFSPLLLAYRRSLKEIQQQINNIHAEYLVNGELMISRQQRYSVLRELERQLVEEMQKLGGLEVEQTTNILTKIFAESYYQTAYAIDVGVATTVSFAVLQPEMVLAVVNSPMQGEMFSSRIWKNKDILVNRVLEELEKSMIQGKDVRKIAKAIQKEFEVSAYEAKRLVQTESARVTNTAQKSIYEQSKVVNRVLLDATLDEKTSKLCRGYDGQIFDANSDYPEPPFHPFCRTVAIGMPDGWTPKRKRENVKGENGKKNIIDYTTYDKWKESRNINA
ncbi:minor capsid protein [Bacillus spongiae]|uniref:Minor capsid protein n=1 Tax=Bacillus spongiae TaxID=2683610 RepID=A0ABU8HJH8_9BACI